VKSFLYDEEIALSWAQSKGLLNCLKLNKTEFKKTAQVLKPDFVTIEKEPRVYLDSDLSRFLGDRKAHQLEAE